MSHDRLGKDLQGNVPVLNLSESGTVETASTGHWLDRLGVGASVTCAVHCAAMPFAVAVIPLLGLEFLLNPATEWLLLGSMGSLAIASLGLGYLKHRKWYAFVPLAAGVASLAFGHSKDSCCEHSHWEHVMFAVTGGLLIAGSHAINLRLCRACPLCQKQTKCVSASSV
jgi:hypothetical protein